MHPSKVTLLVATILVNVCLWTQYVIMRPRSSDFGAITSDGTRIYTLTAASIAYACNLAFVGLVLATPFSKISTGNVDTITASVASYYRLQLAFLPLVRASLRGNASKVWVQGLLILCTVPLAVAAIAAMQTKSAPLIALGILPLLHATVNDAVLYGGCF